MRRRQFRVEQAVVFLVAEQREAIRWALYADEQLLALLEDEQECRAVCEALKALPGPHDDRPEGTRSSRDPPAPGEEGT